MGTLLVCLLALAGCLNAAPGRRVVKFDSWNVQPFGEPHRIHYTNDKPAPANLGYTIKVVSSPGEEYPDFPTAVEVTCKRINVPPKVNGKCKWGFYIYDDKDIHSFCGEREDFKIVTEHPMVHLLFTSGPGGGGEVDCVAQGVYKGSGLSITVGEPPRDPGWFSKPELFSEDSEEMDSSEYGIGPADRKTACKCGWSNKARSRIVDGKLAEENEFPFMAALIETKTKKHLCGATIISESHALTAAHCTDGALRQNTKLSLIVGAHNLKDLEGSDTAEIIGIEKVIQHSKFDWLIVEQDIALLVLEKPIKFTQYVGRVCLPSERLPLDNKNTRVLGWGKTKTDGPSAAILRKLDVRVVPLATCGDKWPKLKTRDATQMCTYAYRKATCSGDSGGPLLWVDPETNRYTLVGIISYGNTWCGDMYPSVNTEVAAFSDWIKDNVKASKPDSETCAKV